MNLEQLTRLAAQGESDRLEFKKSTGDLKGGMETLCGFLNGQGGRVLFGVSKTGKITGQDISDATLQDVAQDVRRLEPPADVVQTRVPVQGTREVLVLATSDRSHGPYAYNGRAYRRIGNTTSLMPQAEYERRLLQRGHPLHRWENQIAGRYRLKQLDMKEIKRAMADARAAARLESLVTDPF
jgi:ATP-dependent DNA helicase RecG